MGSILLLLATATPIYAGTNWAALTSGQSCLAMARSELVAPRGKVQPTIAVAFDRGGTRRGQVSVRLGRLVRNGSQPLLQVGERPFLLLASGDRAWSRDSAQDAAILVSLRSGGAAKLSYRAQGGGGYSDRFLLGGAATAIDSAAATCSR
ncbi:hypothetical protein HMF7854_01740 [Sphingomonas ginkgonis]|uniref:Uncharacterized protein n=1 Tax=Sphingomonas ginkgonis TaxID=2315330 RepID=A0A429V6Z8_9SPHN|nr:hypothetical protein [Sphingomonas ginkgonis]RST29689.1 hypothetical protein HMF7854_01740 [Sphingomonas ginkgonis]